MLAFDLDLGYNISGRFVSPDMPILHTLAGRPQWKAHAEERYRGPEWDWVSTTGNVRCTFIRTAKGYGDRIGTRCCQWAMHGFERCAVHGAKGRRHPLRYRFETKTAAEIYEAHRADPDYLSLREEISLIRTVVQLFLVKIDRQGKLDGQASGEIAAFVTQLAKDISSVVEACSRIEKGLAFSISVEGMEAFLDDLLVHLREEVKDPKIIKRLADKFANADYPIGKKTRPAASTARALKNKDVPDAYEGPKEEDEEEQAVEEGAAEEDPGPSG